MTVRPPPWDAIAWWELRRIPFNLALAAAGAASTLAVIGIGDALAKPGEDAIEPLALFVLILGYAVAANALYTLGWISELLWSGGDTARTAPFRPRVFRLGLVFSVVLTLLPGALAALLWLVFQAR